ncbi:hypothetical protein Ahia01_001232200 [Argonauta hians]
MEQMSCNNNSLQSTMSDISCGNRFLGWNLKGIQTMLEIAAINLLTENLHKMTDLTEELILKREERVLMQSCIQYFSPRIGSQIIPFMVKLVHHLWPKVCEQVLAKYGIDVPNKKISVWNGSMDLTQEQKNHTDSAITGVVGVVATTATAAVVGDVGGGGGGGVVVGVVVVVVVAAITGVVVGGGDGVVVVVVFDVATAGVVVVVVFDVATAGVDIGVVVAVAVAAAAAAAVTTTASVVLNLVLIIGPAGCGKSCCIETFVAVQRRNGNSVSVHSVFVKSQESEQLFGSEDSQTRLWTGGLLPTLIRRVAKETEIKKKNLQENPKTLKDLHLFSLDGMADDSQVQTLLTLLDGNGTMVLPNRHKIFLDKEMVFLWELETMATVSPALLTQAGILVMESQDMDWTIYWNHWLHNQPDPSQHQHWSRLAEKYLPELIKVTDTSSAPPPGSDPINNGRCHLLHTCSCLMQQVLPNKMHTLCALLGVLRGIHSPSHLADYNNIFCVAALWSFFGTVCSWHQQNVSQWWKETFKDNLPFPEDETIFDYCLDLKNNAFSKWTAFQDYFPRIISHQDTSFIYSKKTLSDKFGQRPCLELIRQHLDKKGQYKAPSYTWQNVTNVTYIATINNHQHGTSSIGISDRMLRHFAIFYSTAPDSEELGMIFRRHIDFVFPQYNSTVNEEQYLHINTKSGNITKFLDTIILCTIDVYKKLKSMFLPTPARHQYIFTISTLKSLFSNLCSSISSLSHYDFILQLWNYECYWHFGQRMSNSVDFERYKETVWNTIEKYFTDFKQIQHQTISEDLVFSNLCEKDNGKVSASEKYEIVDGYSSIRLSLSKTVTEYNKEKQPLHLPLYNGTLELICRISKILYSSSSSKNREHMVVIPEGVSSSFYGTLYLSAFLTGWVPVQFQRPSLNMNTVQQSLSFKDQLRHIYQQAGLKNQKICLLVKEKDINNSEDIMVLLMEYILYGNLDYLFSKEQQENIGNSLRNDANHLNLKTSTSTQLWFHFVRNLERNLKICLIISGRSKDYQTKWCHNFPVLLKNTSLVWLPQWSKKHLVNNAIYHVNELTWLTAKQQENVCHLLASMHSSLQQQIMVNMKNANTFPYCSNTSYQIFLQKFVDLAMRRYQMVTAEHHQCAELLHQIVEVEQEMSSIHQRRENMSVLWEQCRESSGMLLRHIGENGATIKQVENSLSVQKKIIQRLRKVLSDYQSGHERAVYKTTKIVANCKTLVDSLNPEELVQLKMVTEPPQEILHIFAALIIIVKNSTSDLTWNKGSISLMANIERFIGELRCFEEYTICEPHLELLQDYVQRESFKPNFIDELSIGNSSCRILCQWVINVTKYHTVLNKKVKTLQEKINKTVIVINEAENQLKTFKEKLKKLFTRRSELIESFQESSLSTQRHENSLQNINKFITDSPRVMAVSYIVEWADEYNGGGDGDGDDGDDVDGDDEEEEEAEKKEAVINCNHSNNIDINTTKHELPTDIIVTSTTIPEECNDKETQRDEELEGIDNNVNSVNSEKFQQQSMVLSKTNIPLNKEPDSAATATAVTAAETAGGGGGSDGGGAISDNRETSHQEYTKEWSDKLAQSQPEYMQNIQQQKHKLIENSVKDNQATCPTLSVQTTSMDDLKLCPVPLGLTPYTSYLYCLLKILVGEQFLFEWIQMGLNVHNLENAAILWSSKNTPLLLVDPHGTGQRQFEWQYKQGNIGATEINQIDLNGHCHDDLNKCLLKNMENGTNTLLFNYSNQLQLCEAIDCIPSFQNMAGSSLVVKGKTLDAGNLTINSGFRLCITSNSADISLPLDSEPFFTIVNYSSCRSMQAEDLKNYIFPLFYPSLHGDYISTIKSLKMLTNSSATHYNFLNSTSKQTQKLSEEYFQKWITWDSYKNQEIKNQNSLVRKLEELNQKKIEVEGISQLAALLYSLLYSMRSIQGHYSFHLEWFLTILERVLIDGNFIAKPEANEGENVEMSRHICGSIEVCTVYHL